ncbi:MAG: hypothetical protein RLZZ628_2208 [Bacteroidota bacterium]
MRIFIYLLCLTFCVICCKSSTSEPQYTVLEVRQWIQSIRDPKVFDMNADTALKTLNRYLSLSKLVLSDKDTGIAFLYHKIGLYYKQKASDTENKDPIKSKLLADSSILHYKKAHQIRQETLGAQHWLTCKTLLNIAVVLLYFKEDVVESEKLLEQANLVDTTYNTATAEPMLKADILYQLGDCATTLDRDEDANNWYELALENYNLAFEQYPKQMRNWRKANYFKTCNNLIQVYNYLDGKTDKAIHLYDQTLQKSKELAQDSILLGDMYMLHALSQRNLKSYKLFFNYIDKSSKRYEREGNIDFLANNWLEMAKTYLELRQLDKALGKAQQAFERLRAYPMQHRRVREACTILGNIYKAQGNWKEASDWYEKAIGSAPKNRFDPQQLEPLLGQSDVLKQIKDYKNNYVICQKADQLIQQMTHSFKTDFSKIHFAEKTRLFYEKAIANATHLYKTEGDKKYFDAIIQFGDAQKSVILSEQLLREENLTHLGVPQKVIETGKKHRAALKSAAEKLQNETNTANIDALQSQFNQLYEANEKYLAGLKTQYPSYSNLKFNTLSIKTDDIRAQLEPQTAVIQYFWGQDTLTTTVVTVKNNLVVTMPLTNDFKNRVAQFRKQVRDTKEPFNGENAKQLYQDLLKKPMDSLLKKGFTPQSLVIIPDDSLSYIAFEALRTPDTKYLVQQYEAISYEYSTKSWVQNHSKKQDFGSRSHSMLALAENYEDATQKYNPKTAMAIRRKQKKFESLNVEEHAKSLVALFPNPNSFFQKTSLLPKQNVLENIKINKPTILHFSGHGYKNPTTPIESCVLFNKELDTNQIWTSKNIYEMTLPQTELVYLMACSTGEGAFQIGEGTQSMTRAFFYAGVPRVISSLWEIPQDDAKYIATFFYTAIQKNTACAKAITDAKKMYLKKFGGTNLHPAFWAGLVLTGNPNSLKVN